MREESGRIVIELMLDDYALEQLIAGITLDNVHAEANFGPAVGKETL